ncbi:hypothetical protein PhCBS80983_g00910 [Powellomyces hirtus]|uniref:DUF1279 domain-containing protein n=1 Tax=Powellomyces hirtus TaxID=109895 RepID=A0A507ECZ1_9FUNG|nr:hypothetical protein PhCBS80983_g00910 [Powellomyces hirtus]
MSNPPQPQPHRTSLLSLPRRVFSYLHATTSHYGPAWLVLSTLLSWSNLLLIYLYLHTTHHDVTHLVRSWNLGPNVESVAQKGGLFALAVVVNKLLSPLRFVVCLAILRGGAAPVVNTWIEERRNRWRAWRGLPPLPTTAKEDDKVV